MDFALPARAVVQRGWGATAADVAAAQALAWMPVSRLLPVAEPLPVTLPAAQQSAVPAAVRQRGRPRSEPVAGPPSSAHGHCVCRKSRCLKLYCVCFASGSACTARCMCTGCENVSGGPGRESEVKRRLEENSRVFQSKVAAGTGHMVGCRCKNSSCVQKYCECYNAGVACSKICRCKLCGNADAAPAKKEVAERSEGEEEKRPRAKRINSSDGVN